MIHQIGHFVNPTIPKLGKLHRIFEHLFILMRYFFIYMLRWIFYWFGLLIMMHLNWDPWRVYSFSLHDLVWWTSLEEQDYLGLPWGLKPKGWIPGPTHRMMMRCLYRPKRHLGGSHLSPTIQTTFLWRPKHHLWGLDVTLGIGFGGDWRHLAFGGLVHSYPTQWIDPLEGYVWK